MSGHPSRRVPDSWGSAEPNAQESEPRRGASRERAGYEWRAAGRALLARMIGELAYEEVLAPAPDGSGWRLDLAGAQLHVRGQARHVRLVAGRPRLGGA